MVAWIIFFLFIPGFAQEASAKEVLVRFSSQVYTVEDQSYLAVTYRNAPHWHTYWKNPGDAGLPFKFKFELAGKEISLPSLEWPAPKHYWDQGRLLSFGYDGEYTFFFLLNKALAKEAKEGKITVISNWLVCKDSCIPGKGEFSSGQGEFEVSSDILQKRLDNIPQKTASTKVSMEMEREEGLEMGLYYHLETSQKVDGLMLIPFPHDLFDFKRENLGQRDTGIYGRYTMEWAGEYATPPAALPRDGRFIKPPILRFLFNNPESGKVEIVEKKIASFNLTTGRLKKKYQTANKASLDKGGKKTKKQSLFYIIILALLGGLILNCMPCVLPVILLKLFSLIKDREADRKTIFWHNMTYALGVLFSFLLLSSIVVVMKKTGEQVGWGFQLQSPVFIAIIIVILFFFTLNLFGLFEFKTPGGSFIGNLKIKKGITSHFLSGILSTILATPCSAPFLGTALAFAFTGSTFSIFVVFMAIGIGLALPFIMTGIYPGLISFFPKPGAWMEHLKKFMGLTVILSIIWLLDIFYSQTKISHTLVLEIVLCLLFFAIYAFRHIFKNRLWRGVFLSLPLLLFIHLLFSLDRQEEREVAWQPWSEQALKELQEQNKTVFMNFTAKWCFTCKVNERLIFSREGFFNLLKEHSVVPMLADWTKRDVTIGNWLEKQNVAGIPAYFIQTGKGDIINLGEITTLGEIKSYLLNDGN